MVPDGFLDTNVLIDALIDTSEHHLSAIQLLDRVSRGEVALHLSPTVVLEATFVLTKRYRAPRAEIASALVDVLSLTSVISPNKDELRAALDLWTRESPLSFADCYHLVLAESLGLDAIYSFDKKMDRYRGVRRLEP